VAQDGVFWIILRSFATPRRHKSAKLGSVLLCSTPPPPPLPRPLGTLGKRFGGGKISDSKDYTGDHSWKSFPGEISGMYILDIDPANHFLKEV